MNKTANKKGCGRFTVQGKIKDEELWGFSRLLCKKWSCPVCGPKNARKLRGAINRVAEDKNLKRFLTLTLDPSKYEGDSVQYINNCWKKLRVYLSRKYGQKISFIRVLEFHKSGHAHFHILIDRFIPFEWIKSAWQAVGGGGVDIRYVDVHRVARYLSSYLTKETLLNLPHNRRRYATSKDIKLFEKKEPSGWSFVKFPLEIPHFFLERRKAVTSERWDSEGQLIYFATQSSFLRSHILTFLGVHN